MNPQRILQADGLEIIFNNRNKSYGAYELRRNYNKRIKKALAFTVLFVLSVISYPIIANYMSADLVIPIPHRVLPDVPVFVPDEVIEKIEEPINDPPKIDVSTTPNIPTEIAPTEEFKDPIDEEKVPVDAVPGSENHQGTDVAGTLGSNDGSETGKDIGTETGTTTTPEIIVPDIPEDIVFDSGVIDEQPEFPGGEEALMKFLISNIHYPQKALQTEVEGRVTLGFVIDKNGEIDEIKIMRGIGNGCDEEAVRVVEKMPRWKAGKSGGKAVKTYFNLPITFDIED